MSGMAPGNPVGLAMGSGIAPGMAGGVQAGRRRAGKDVAAWRLQQHGAALITPDGGTMDGPALLAVVAGKPGNRG